tara:strand:+ start:2910 stop:3149 length:240 start_codon:yes stop_codon:yes gene_type:complete
MKYQVGVKIFNSFEVEADSEEEAEQKVRELDVYKTLMDCDYNITYVDEIKSSEKQMLLNKVFVPMTDRIICDDEHGNTL